MFYHLLIAVLGTAGLLGAWVAVQSLKRRSDPRLGAGDDVLACGGCGSGHCSCGAMVDAAEGVDHACAAHHKE
jgi:hypothetical protein